MDCGEGRGGTVFHKRWTLPEGFWATVSFKGRALEEATQKQAGLAGRSQISLEGWLVLFSRER